MSSGVPAPRRAAGSPGQPVSQARSTGLLCRDYPGRDQRLPGAFPGSGPDGGGGQAAGRDRRSAPCSRPQPSRGLPCSCAVRERHGLCSRKRVCLRLRECLDLGQLGSRLGLHSGGPCGRGQSGREEGIPGHQGAVGWEGTRDLPAGGEPEPAAGPHGRCLLAVPGAGWKKLPKSSFTVLRGLRK